MRVLVCGGRNYSDKGCVYFRLGQFTANPAGEIVIISGGAKGADRLGEEWAKEFGAELLIFPADWEKHGRAAGHIRNAQMLEEGKPDMVLAFPGGKGTANMIMQAKRKKVPVIQIDDNGWIKP